jgi:hypothetical protein
MIEVDREPLESRAIDEIGDAVGCPKPSERPLDLDLPDAGGADEDGFGTLGDRRSRVGLESGPPLPTATFACRGGASLPVSLEVPLDLPGKRIVEVLADPDPPLPRAQLARLCAAARSQQALAADV